MIPSIAPDEALVGEPDLRAKPRTDAQRRCRTNSRRGATDPAQRSYPPVQSVCRALDVLRTVNRLRIASVQAIHEATGFPKPTIVRMLETLTARLIMPNGAAFDSFTLTKQRLRRCRTFFTITRKACR